MKVEYSPRVEAELVRLFRDSAERFGLAVANRTLGKVRRTFESTLSDYPYIGQSLRSRNLYRLPIPGTPFVAYYQLDVDAQTITVLAVFHGRRDRSEFESH